MLPNLLQDIFSLFNESVNGFRGLIDMGEENIECANVPVSGGLYNRTPLGG